MRIGYGRILRASNATTSKQMNKSWMNDDFQHIVSLFREYGIMIYGTFILGYDHDTDAVFNRTLEFALGARLFLANFNPLMPTPGTPLYARLESKGACRSTAGGYTSIIAGAMASSVR